MNKKPIIIAIALSIADFAQADTTSGLVAYYHLSESEFSELINSQN